MSSTFKRSSSPCRSADHKRLAAAFHDERSCVIQAVLFELIEEHFPFSAGFLLCPDPTSVTKPNISVVQVDRPFLPVLGVFFKVTEDTPSALIRATSHFIEQPSSKFALGITKEKWSLYMQDFDSSPMLYAEGSDFVGGLAVKLDEIVTMVMGEEQLSTPRQSL